jgi:ribose 5-phosphate isomerase RpiB
VLSAEDLRRNLNGHRELLLEPGAVLTPLASEELRERGVRVTLLPYGPGPLQKMTWGYALDRPQALVQAAVHSLARDGLALKELSTPLTDLLCRWSRALAECVASGACPGGVLFCEDPGLACCVANKVPGLRAVPVSTVAQAARASLTLAANLLAVEMPGRTFYEVRQILRILCTSTNCPDGVACTLQELDGHAHR